MGTPHPPSQLGLLNNFVSFMYFWYFFFPLIFLTGAWEVSPEATPAPLDLAGSTCSLLLQPYLTLLQNSLVFSQTNHFFPLGSSLSSRLQAKPAAKSLDLKPEDLALCSDLHAAAVIAHGALTSWNNISLVLGSSR